MENIGMILPSILKKRNIDKKVREADVFLNYDMIVGDKLAEVSWPIYIRNQILFIGVESSVWSQQLYFFKPQIIKNINDYFGHDHNIIKDVKFHISTIKDKKTIRQKKYVKKTDPIISDKKLKIVYNISLEIRDETLREKFGELMIKDIKYKLKKGEDNCLST
jgi:hypothetical protein